MNFRHARDYFRRRAQRNTTKDSDWFGNKIKRETKEMENIEVTQLAQLIAARIEGAAVQEVDKTVRGCAINGLMPAIVAINGELGGPPFADGELKVMCAKLGVEAASGLSSVLHLTSVIGVQGIEGEENSSEGNDGNPGTGGEAVAGRAEG